MERRHFLGGLLALPAASFAARELAAEVAIIGGGFGGCAAALGALRNGARVVMTEENLWIGGQATSQAVPPDEHPYIEQFGCTRAYRDYRNGVREYYKRHYPLTEAARARAYLNPGDSWVSRITHEPRVSLAVLEAMLAPYLASGRLTLLIRHRAIAADTEGDRIRSVTVRSSETGAVRTIMARIFVDATETGDLLPLTRTEFVTGFESRRDTGEPHAPAEAQPANHQACTVCFAMDYRPGEDHTIDKPAEYEFWRDYVPKLTPAFSGPKLFSLVLPDPQTLEKRQLSFEPECADSAPRCLWTYRRIAAKRNFLTGAYPSDVSLVNWPQNDYWLGNLYGGTEAENARHLARAKQLSLSLLYWLQKDFPRPDGKSGWPGLRLRPDVTGTEDGLAQYPYIRESRRIRAELTVLEQHVATESRKGETLAVAFPDTCGIGSYRIDLHPSTGGDNSIDIGSLPFQIPLGALIPVRVDNLLAACKNLGVTHIANGCYRLHPVEWNIGEAAGVLAAEAIARGESPRGIRAKRLPELQAKLRAQGFELEWPRLLPR